MCSKCDENTELTKQCNGPCGKIKTLFHFDSANEIIDKHRGKCKVCSKIQRDKIKEANRTNTNKEYVEFKKCGHCKIIKHRNDFYPDEAKKLGLPSWCKFCQSEQSKKPESKLRHNLVNKKYKANNKEKISEQNKKPESKLKHSERNKKYRTKNKEKLNKRQRERRQNNVIVRLRDSVSALIRYALKLSKGNKGGKSILDILSYTIPQLKEHLETQWKIPGNEWMNWDNHGMISSKRKTWQIDHIIPQSALPYDTMEHPNFQKAWALSNLQPLEAFANIRKSNKIITTPVNSNASIELKSA